MRSNRKAKPNGQGKKKKATIVPMVRGNDKTVTLPSVMSKVMQSDFEISKGSRRGSIRVRGQDWLGRLQIPAGSVAGQTIGEFYINPSDYPGTRLALFAQLYDKFRFQMLKFKYVPYASTATPGSIIIAYDRDISDVTPPANDNGVRAFLSMLDAVSGPIWQPLEATCPLSHPEEGLFTNEVPGGDPRLAYQGQVYVALMEPPSAAASLAGDLFVEFDVELFDPQLETAPSVGIASTSGPSSSIFGPAVNDTLTTFVEGAVPGSNKSSSNVYVPKLGQDGRAYLDLAQGVYRIYQSLAQTQYGNIDLGTPRVADIVPNDPKPAPAPQPQISQISTTVSYDFPGLAVKSALYAIPPGGARVYSTASDLTGYAGSQPDNAQTLQVDKLASAWSSLSNFL